jgi:hypothetical protein
MRRYTCFFAAVVAAVACLFPASMPASAYVIVNDGTFDNASWTLVQRPYGSGGGSGSAAQVLSGGFGDNGPARQTSNSAGPNNSGCYNASIYTAYTYDPGVSGALAGISISIDARFISGLSSLGAVVEQNGLIWMAGSSITTPSWLTYTFTPVVGDWFLINPSGGVAGPGPDFTVAGLPMRFGFFTGNGTGVGGNPYTHVGLNDNFVVRAIPEPGAAALVVFGGLVAARRRR